MHMSRFVVSSVLALAALARSTTAFAPSAASIIAARNPATAISARRSLATGAAFAGRVSPLRSASRGLASLNMKERERTFIMVKPDAVQRGLVGNIITRFEQKGFKLVALKMMQADEALLKEHYKDLVSKPFFPSLLSYMTSGPVVPMVWEGDGVVKAGRTILGATKPSESAPGTVRGDYAIDVGRNVCHGSDAVETAKVEIALWFKEGVTSWDSHSESWIYE